MIENIFNILYKLVVISFYGLVVIGFYGIVIILLFIFFVGPFAIPISYAIFLWVKREWSSAVAFMITAAVLILANYSTAYYLRSVAMATRRRRGIDLTFIICSLTGLIIAVLLVSVWASVLFSVENLRQDMICCWERSS